MRQQDVSRVMNQSIDNKTDGGGSEKSSAMSMLQQMTGCSKEQINKLNSLISFFLEKAGIKQED